jgi:hypothetical protein
MSAVDATLCLMLSGRLIAESCKPGFDIQVPNLRLVRIGRHDVTETTLPADERDASPTPGGRGPTNDLDVRRLRGTS